MFLTSEAYIRQTFPLWQPRANISSAVNLRQGFLDPRRSGRILRAIQISFAFIRITLLLLITILCIPGVCGFLCFQLQIHGEAVAGMQETPHGSLH